MVRARVSHYFPARSRAFGGPIVKFKRPNFASKPHRRRVSPSRFRSWVGRGYSLTKIARLDISAVRLDHRPPSTLREVNIDR